MKQKMARPVGRACLAVPASPRLVSSRHTKSRRTQPRHGEEDSTSKMFHVKERRRRRKPADFEMVLAIVMRALHRRRFHD